MSALKYVSDDFSLKGKSTYYAGKGTAKQRQVEKAGAIESLKKNLVDTDVLRTQQGAPPATPTLRNYIDKVNQVKIDNELMSRGQMPKYSKPTYEQLQKMHSINQETRAKLDPNQQNLEISLRADEFSDRNRILNGELPKHRTASKRELEYIGQVLNARQIKAYGNDATIIQNIENDPGKEELVKRAFDVNGIDDDDLWNSYFHEPIVGVSAPSKPVPYENWLNSMPKYPGSTGVSDVGLKSAMDYIIKAQSPYENTTTMKKAENYAAYGVGSFIGLVAKSIGFGATFVTNKLVDAFGDEYSKASMEWMQKNRELPWQPTTDYIDKLNSELRSTWEDPDWRSSSLSDKLTTGLPKTMMYLFPDVASSILAFGMGGPALVGSSTAYDLYNQAIDYGVSSNNALNGAILTSAAVTALDKIGFKSLFPDATTGVTKNIFSKILTSEAVTEGAQEVIQKAYERTFRDDLTWDEFAEATAMSMLGGLGADVTIGRFNDVMLKVKQREYQDAMYIQKTGEFLDSAGGPKPPLEVKEAAFKDKMTTEKTLNPLAMPVMKGPSRDPINPPKLVETQQNANSIRTGDKVYMADDKNANIRIIADPLGRSYNEYEAASVRAMDYDEAVQHMQDNFNNLTPDEQAAVKAVVDFTNPETMTIDNVAKAFQIYTDPNAYNAVMLRDDVRGTVMAPFGLERIANSADMLAVRNSMMAELLAEVEEQSDNNVLRQFMNDTKAAQAYQQMTDGKMLKEMYDIAKKTEQAMEENPFVTEARQYETFEQFQDAMVDGIAEEVVNRMTKAKKTISVQKVIIDKYQSKKKGVTLGTKTTWNVAKKLFTKMANSKMHNIQEGQKLMYAYMVKNPTVNKYFTPAAKDLIMRKIIALGKKTTEDSLRRGLTSVIATIDKKMTPARLKAVLDKGLTSKQVKNAKLDWEGNINGYDRWRALPNEIKAATAAARAEMTDANLERLDNLINEQREIYDIGRQKMHEKVEQEKMDKLVVAEGIIDEIKNGKKSKPLPGMKFLDSPMLRAQRIGDKFFKNMVLKTAEWQANMNTFKRKVHNIIKQFDLTYDKVKNFSQSISNSKNAIKKYGVEMQITVDGQPKQFKFSKAELSYLYMAAKDPDARYALLGEHDSKMIIGRDPSLPSTFFTMNETQINNLVETVESDPDTMVMVNFATELFRMGYEEFAVIYKKNTGLDLPNNPNYVPIDVWGAVMNNMDDTIQSGDISQIFAGFEQTLGMLKKRTRNVKKTINVQDIMGLASKYEHNAAMYVGYGVPVKQNTMMLKSIGETMVSTIGKEEVDYWKTYIRNLNPFIAQKSRDIFNKVANKIASNTTRSILWARVPAVMKQTASLMVAGSVDPNFGLVDIAANSVDAGKLLMSSEKKEVLYDVFPELFGIRLTMFDPTLEETGVTSANDLLSVMEYDKTFKGRGIIEKASKIGMEPLVKMNNLNYDMIAATYLSKQAKAQGKDINQMSFIELSEFASQYTDKIRTILIGSQPQYGLANRIPALVDQTNWLSKTLFMFKAASLAGVNSARRVIELRSQGKIDNIKAATMFSNAFIWPSLWCAMITMAYRAAKEGLTDDDEEELKKVEEAQIKLLDVSMTVAQEMAGQFPLLGEMVYYVKQTMSGNTYKLSAINPAPVDFLNKAFSAIGGLSNYAKMAATKEEYQKAGDGFKKGDLKYKNERNIEKAIENGVKILDSLTGINLSEPTTILNKMIDY